MVSALRPGRRFAAVLDLGCGTGLNAPLWAAQCEQLVGVDLSEAMLRQAAARGGYTELVRGDLDELLPKMERTFDLVVATDTLSMHTRPLDPPQKTRGWSATHTRAGPVSAQSTTESSAPSSPSWPRASPTAASPRSRSSGCPTTPASPGRCSPPARTRTPRRTWSRRRPRRACASSSTTRASRRDWRLARLSWDMWPF